MRSQPPEKTWLSTDSQASSFSTVRNDPALLLVAEKHVRR